MKLDSEILFKQHKEKRLHGRFITNDKIEIIIESFPPEIEVEVVGKSVFCKPIYSLTYGKGPIKILMWSQMHGNESTTTNAIFDLLSTLLNELMEYSEKFTLKIIPILNPDGAEAYTRVNGNKIDLNRDAQDLSQPESNILREEFLKFQPNFCLNLHGQRTIFGAGANGSPATISFLAPTQDHERSITQNRKIAMQLICAMNESLQRIIPGMVGVYDDSFNLNCTGDTFQAFGVPTILFEAGHFQKDYEREYTRYLIYHCYLVLLEAISTNSYLVNHVEDYFKIPQNEKCFHDVIIRDVDFSLSKGGFKDVAIQYYEQLQNADIEFVPKVVAIGNLETFYGHREFQANGVSSKNIFKRTINVGDEVTSILWKNENLSLTPEKN